jgi:molybdate transport system substrate-binding protein
VKLAVLLALAGALALCGGCGGSGEAAGAEGAGGSLTVFAASSLEEALGEYAETFPVGVKTSFAGSDTLAAQIRQGARPDLFAAADTEYPEQLHREGLVEKPVVFAGNELVLAAPAGSDVHSLADLEKPGTKLVIGDESVPVGQYTRTVLERMPAAEREAIEANVVSEESEVSSVVAKLQTGAADAGFVYATDAKAAGGELQTVRLPAALQPRVAYAAAVVAGSGDPAQARKFLAGLLHGEGQEDLRAAGFLPPP